MGENAGKAVENVVAVLGVRDLHASIRFYREKLGFKLDWGGDTFRSQLCSMSRDGCAVMLRAVAVRTVGEIWVGGPASELWDAVKNDATVKVVQPLTNHPWALDVKIADPDGNVIWMGEESRKDLEMGAVVE